MKHTDEQMPEESAAATATKSASRLAGHVSRIVNWSRSSRLRMMLAGTAAVALVGLILFFWSYLAHLVVDRQQDITLNMALAALDRRDYDEAKNLTSRMRETNVDEEDFGGVLFVLGIIKAYQADNEWSNSRKKAMHLLAARYLQKARQLRVPEERKEQLLYQLGRSLVLGNQSQQGIDVLREALEFDTTPKREIHKLLTKAYLSIAEPNLEAAVQQIDALLKIPDLSPQEASEARIQRSDILLQQGQLADAEAQIESLQATGAVEAQVLRIAGQLALQKALRLAANTEAREKLLADAIEHLREAQLKDPHNGGLARLCMYWIGKCHEAQGDYTAASVRFDRIGKLYSETNESIAATMAKAELARAQGDLNQALAGYRAVLESIDDPVVYVNPLLTLSDLKKQLLNAHGSLVDMEHYSDALELVELFPMVFDLAKVVELRAKTHEKWGNKLLRNAEHLGGRESAPLTREGRYQLRAAGKAYEELAELRFATRHYTSDLWNAAENYFHGQNFSHTTRVLNEYLHHEARKQNAMALLRLGQALLARGKTDRAIAELEECIEMHPRDAVVYQARLECVKGYLQVGEDEKAEALLLKNLTGGNLAPSSVQWRDSLFALGEFFYNTGEYLEAASKLEEAIARYPNAPQTLMARYSLARSFHNAAEEPAGKAREAKTENERLKNRKLRDEHLTSALHHYQNVQRSLTLEDLGPEDELERLLLRNCYMMQGTVLFQLRRYEEARKAYANVSTLYQNEPFVLESFVHIANCWRRLNQPLKARGAIEQAKLVLDRLPDETNFKLSTNFNRQQWELLLNEMSDW